MIFDTDIMYSLIEQQFGISKKEIEELDLQDGKKDGCVDGISLFHFLRSGEQIHNSSPSETLEKLDLYMKDTVEVDIAAERYSSAGRGYTDLSDRSNYEISTDEIVKQLINEIHKIGFASLDKPISKINENNVVEVIEKYQKASEEKNSLFGKVYDHESLFEAILDESISDDKKKKYINHIKDALVKRINSLNGDASFTGKLFSLALDSAIKKWWPFQNSDKLDQLCNKFIQIIKQLETMQEAGEKVTPAKAKKINRGFLQQLKWMGISTEDLLGNGYFDNDSMQMTGNCWIHAGINSMISIPNGKEHLNNLVSKTSNGNTVVYLPGAKDKGLPKPKGDGIFVYTQKQISQAIKNESAGDGEYAVFSLAIRDARRAEQNSNKAGSSVGGFDEFCKWVYGDKAKISNLSWGGLLSSNDCTQYAETARTILKLHEIDPDNDIFTKEDINIEEQKWRANYDSPEKMVKKLKECFNSKKYLINVSLTDNVYNALLSGKKPSSENRPIVHAVTVIAINGDDVYIKDSNYPKKPLKINIFDLIKCCPIQVFKID